MPLVTTSLSKESDTQTGRARRAKFVGEKGKLIKVVCMGVLMTDYRTYRQLPIGSRAS
jgi:hypothetical protein